MKAFAAPIIVTGSIDLEPLERNLSTWKERFGWPHEYRLVEGCGEPRAWVENTLADATAPQACFFVVDPSGWLASAQEETEGDPWDRLVQRFREALVKSCAACPHHVFLLSTPPPETASPQAIAAALRLEERLIAGLEGLSQLERFPASVWADAASNEGARGHALMESLAKMVSRQVFRLIETAPNVILVGGEDTLLEGSEPENPNVGTPHREVQKGLADIHTTGAELGIVSPLSEEALRESLWENPETPLKEADVSIRITADVSSTVESIQTWAKQHAKVPQQIAFLTKNPSLVEAMRKEIPGIVSILLPTETSQLTGFLKQLWVLDRPLAASPSASEENTSLTVKAVSPSVENHPRMAQLTQETVKFNMTARSFSEAEVKDWLSRPYHFATLFRVSDDAADYGLAGLVMYERVKQALLVHNFLLSHPATGMAAECHMLAKLGEIAAEHHCDTIDLPFFKQEENTSAFGFLDSALRPYCNDLPEEGWQVYRIPVQKTRELSCSQATLLIDHPSKDGRLLSAVLQGIASGGSPLSSAAAEEEVPTAPADPDVASPFSIVASSNGDSHPELERVSPTLPTSNSSPFAIVDPEATPTLAQTEDELATGAVETPLTNGAPVSPFIEVPLAEQSEALRTSEDGGNDASDKLSSTPQNPALFVISSDSSEALYQERSRVADSLSRLSTLGELETVAAELATTRHGLRYRSTHLVRSPSEAKTALGSGDIVTAEAHPSVTFLFPDSWSVPQGIETSLYDQHLVFREVIDWCSEIHKELTGDGLHDILFSDKLPPSIHLDASMFAFELAMAKQWMAWGIYPDACYGQGIGEFVAACLSDIFSPEEGLAMVAKRSELISLRSSPGRMLLVDSAAETLRPFLNSQVELAAYQSETSCLVGGTTEGTATLTKVLQAQDIAYHSLPYRHSRNTANLAPMVHDLEQVFREVDLQGPQIPMLSGATGDWITPENAGDPHYWASSAVIPIQNASAFRQLANATPGLTLEVGIGDTLTQALQASSPDQLTTFPGLTESDTESHLEHTLRMLGQLWSHGATVDWASYYQLPEVMVLASDPEAKPGTEIPQEETSPTQGSDHNPATQFGDPFGSSGPGRNSPLPSTGDRLRAKPLEEALLISSDPFASPAEDQIKPPKESPTGGPSHTLITEAPKEDAMAPFEPKKEAPLSEERPVVDEPSAFVEGKIDTEPNERTECLNLKSDASPEPEKPTTHHSAGASETRDERAPEKRIQAPDGANTTRKHPVTTETPDVETSPTDESSSQDQPCGDLPICPSAKLQERFEAIERALTNLRETLYPHTLKNDENLTPLQVEVCEDIGKIGNLIEEARESAPLSVALLSERRKLTASLPETRFDLFVQRRKGHHVWDADGRAYLDLCQHLLPHVFGYESPEISRWMTEHLNLADRPTPAELEIELAKKLSALFGKAHVRFTPCSRSALQEAIAMSQRQTQRPGAAIVSLKSFQTKEQSHVFVAPEDPNAILEIERRHLEMAAIVMDPLSVAPLAIPERRQFFESLRALADRLGAALVLDERWTAMRWSSEDGRDLSLLQPDLILLGETMAGGLPFGAIVGSSPWVAPAPQGDGFAQVPDSLPLAMALALSSRWEVMPQPMGASQAKALAEKLHEIIEAKEVTMRISRLGGLLHLARTKNATPPSLVEEVSLTQGLRLNIDGINVCSAGLQAEDTATIATAFEESVNQLQEAGHLIRDPESHVRRLRDRSDAENLAYWKASLEGCELQWPSSAPNPGAKASNGAVVRALSDNVSQALRARAIEWKVETGDLITVAIHRLMRGYAHQDHVALLTAPTGQVANHSIPLAIAPLPTPWTIRSAAETVHNIRKSGEEKQLHQPQAWVDWLKNDGPEVGFQLSHPTKKLALHWIVGEAGRVECAFDQERIAPADVEIWMDCLHTLIEGLAQSPADTEVDGLPILSAAAFESVYLKPSRENAPEYPDVTVNKLVEDCVTIHPHRIAIQEGKRTLTYQQLDTHATQWAKVLVARGVKQGSIVAIQSNPTANWVIASLATLKAGAAYLPLPEDTVLTNEQIKRYGISALLKATPASKANAGADRNGTSKQDPTELSLNFSELQELSQEFANVALSSFTMDPVTTEASAAGNSQSESPALYFLDDEAIRPLPHPWIVEMIYQPNYADFGPNEIYAYCGAVNDYRAAIQQWGPLANGGTLVFPTGATGDRSIGETLRAQRVNSLIVQAEELKALWSQYSAEFAWLHQLIIVDELPSESLLTEILRQTPTKVHHAVADKANGAFHFCRILSRETLREVTTKQDHRIGTSLAVMRNTLQLPVPKEFMGHFDFEKLGEVEPLVAVKKHC